MHLNEAKDILLIKRLSLKVGRGREDFGTRRRAGIRGRDKQIAPDFCAELVKYFF